MCKRRRDAAGGADDLTPAQGEGHHEDELGSDLTVEAAYYKEDNSLSNVEQICDNLRLIATVTYVEIRDNPRVVRENR